MCLKKRERTTDLLGLSEPLCKLIDTVSCGIGKVYEPIHVRRMAKAQADQINLIATTINNNLQLPIKYKDENITIDSSDANGLVQRAENRFLFEQIKKQQNIESVVDVAYKELENEKEVSKEPVDSDWINSFFDFVANVSDEAMQCLWGKLLAGEVKEPGSFSLRTLDVLRKMSKKEAELFKNIVPYVFCCVGDDSMDSRDYFLIYGSFLKKYSITFPRIFDLSVAGVVSRDQTISIGFQLKTKESETMYGSKKDIRIKNISKNNQRFSRLAYVLTEAGAQLLPIVLDTASEIPNTYYNDCIAELRESDGFSTTVDDGVFISEILEHKGLLED